jgi:gliding motility-associated-like protein
MLNGANISGANTSSSTYNTSSGGNYTVIVGNTNGCTTTSAPTNVVVNALPTATISGTLTFCSGDTTILSATSSVAGSGTINSYLWQLNGTNISGANTSSSTYSAYTGGNYTVIVGNTNGCNTTSAQSVVTVKPTPIATAISPITINCLAPNATLDGTGSSAGASYLWTTVNGNIVSGSTALTATTNQVGIYNLTVNLNGCSNTATVTVNSTPGPIASFSANPASGIAPLTVDFTNNSQNANTYSWTFGNGNTASTMDASNIYNIPGTYTAILTASANGTCPDYDSLTVIVLENFTIVIPNIFTPNGDGINELYKITVTGEQEFDAQIFDRWGIKMTEWTSSSGGWDGKNKGSKEAADGTYYYIIKVTPLGKKEAQIFKGSMMLTR